MKKILILSANPNNTDALRLDREVREIQKAIALHPGSIKVIAEWAVGVNEVRRALLNHRPQIVHFSGHGGGDRGLVLEKTNGQMHFASTDSLAQLFQLLEDDIECVFLNACCSSIQATAISQHIDWVIGMTEPIEDNAAIAFAVGFYDALSAGRTYEEAYHFGCNAIAMHGIPASNIPVLKTRPRSPYRSAIVETVKKEPDPQPQNTGAVNINITGAQLSNGFVMIQGNSNQISMNNQQTSSVSEKQLSQEEVIHMLAKIEELVEATEDLPENTKAKSLKYLERAKEELESPEADKDFAAKDLKQMAKTLKTTKRLWNTIEPILTQLPPWLEVQKNYFE